MRILLISLLCLLSVNVYAEKVLVSYAPDGKVIITYGKRDYVEKNYETIVNRSELLKDLPYELLDKSQLPKNPDGTKKDREYWTGRKGEGVRIDEAKKNADKTAKENKDKDIDDKLRAINLSIKELKEILK